MKLHTHPDHIAFAWNATLDRARSASAPLMADSIMHLGEAIAPSCEDDDTVAKKQSLVSIRPGGAGGITDWLTLIRAEYLEVPGLRLTLREAERFWGLDSHRCKSLLEALVAASFLTRSAEGKYMRAEVSR